MKIRNQSGKAGTGLIIFLIVTMGAGLTAAAGQQRVTLKEGKPVLLEDGKIQPLTKNLDLTSAITVLTNGTFTVNQGQPRKLEEGQILDQEGMLTSPNGTTLPVIDHITRVRGQVVLYRDGTSHVVDQDITLPTGVRVKPNGVMDLPNGQLRRLLDGQILKLDGSAFASTDTVTLRDGQVFVQRDGSQFPVGARQSIMMNDGTKVFGTGKLVKRDGQTIQLNEGQVIKLDGIAFPQL